MSLASVFLIVFGPVNGPAPVGALRSTLGVMVFALVLAFISSVGTILLDRKIRQDRQAGRVFIIYARRDAEAAKSVSDLLQRHGFSPWLDLEQLIPGQDWQAEVSRAMMDSEAAVVLLSRDLNSDSRANAQLRAARRVLTAREKDVFPLVPVKLDECAVPVDMEGVRCLVWSNPDSPDRLLEALAHVTGREPAVGSPVEGQSARY
jgi:hypothetical protein